MTAKHAATSETASMRRAKEWLAEMQAEAVALGRPVSPGNVRLLEHMATCRDGCELRENMDPAFCDLAETIKDGDDDA